MFIKSILAIGALAATATAQTISNPDFDPPAQLEADTAADPAVVTDWSIAQATNNNIFVDNTYYTSGTQAVAFQGTGSISQTIEGTDASTCYVHALHILFG